MKIGRSERRWAESRLQDLQRIDFAKGGGLVPLVAQHVDTGRVHMVGYADREALEASLSTGLLHFHSRRRDALWKKGETSGNTLRVIDLCTDCDDDAVLALVLPSGPTCHTGAEACFEAGPFLVELAALIEDRARAVATGEAVPGHTARLLADRNLRLKKLTEEAGELAVACADGDADAVAAEAADLLYHSLVACRAAGVRLQDIIETLRRRHA